MCFYESRNIEGQSTQIRHLRLTTKRKKRKPSKIDWERIKARRSVGTAIEVTSENLVLSVIVSSENHIWRNRGIHLFCQIQRLF